MGLVKNHDPDESHCALRAVPFPCRSLFGKLGRAACLFVILASLAGCSLIGSDRAADATPTPVVSPTATEEPTPIPSPTPTPPPADTGPTPTPSPTPDPEVTDRLVVQDENFQLFTIGPEGNGFEPLTVDDGTVNSQPTWSPDGSHIAWTNFDPATGISFIHTDRFDRSDRREKSVLSPPFYLGWDNASSQIAFLAPSRGGIDFGLVEISDEGEAVRLDRGEPFWFAWGPLGDELLVHASHFRLDRIDVDDSTVVIVSPSPADFQAPAWLGAEGFVVYADQIDGTNYLLTSGTGGENQRLLASYEGYLILSVSPDGSRIAYEAISLDPEPGIITASQPVDPALQPVPLSEAGGLDLEAQPASFAQDPELPELPVPDPDDPFADPIDETLINTLNVIGTFGGDALQITFDRPLGFFWSPTGEKLAYLLPGPTTDSLQWWFWDTADQFFPIPGPTFVPSPVFETSYLPFFDQYEHNVEYWSPEGDRIVYAGTDVQTGRSGIWTVEADFNATPQFVVQGEFAAWSPGSAGGAASAL